jgi:hypothetical protein
VVNRESRYPVSAALNSILFLRFSGWALPYKGFMHSAYRGIELSYGNGYFGRLGGFGLVGLRSESASQAIGRVFRCRKNPLFLLATEKYRVYT